MTEEKIIEKICNYLGRNYLLKNSKSMKWVSISKVKEELLNYCKMSDKDKKSYFIDLCNLLNKCIPCKSQDDIDKMTSLLQDMTEFPTNPIPQIYWDREVWIDSGFDDEKCMNMLIHTDKLYFEPSDDMTERPGVYVKYKWMNEQK